VGAFATRASYLVVKFLFCLCFCFFYVYLLPVMVNKDVYINFVDLRQLQMPSLPKFLVFVNPFSGPGRALHIFQRSIVPVFAEAGLQYHLIVTGYSVW